jgi:histidine ammonia-lyase
MFSITGNNLTVQNSIKLIENNILLKIDKSAIKKIQKSRSLVEKWIQDDKAIYGITTGFGEFKDVKISHQDLETLQKNLIISHSAGVGKYLPDNIVRLMILFRINSLCKGNSGVRVELVEALINIFNNKIIPLVPSQGSVGSSGDLAPLSHLALTLIGKGYCKLDGEVLESESALKKCGLSPFVLSAKEGLALINGTQMMSAYMCFTVWESERLAKLADIAGTVSLEALKGTDSAFDEKIQRIRPHKGQINTAYNLRALLKNSGIMKSHRDCGKVQDAYSLRCMPQVHGAVKDTIRYCKEVLEIEINSVTDNPLIFPEDSEYLTGGNFHGEPIAFIADYLAIAMSELANISERRIARLVDGSLSGLPRFLTTEGGLNSGLMIAQSTAASLVSENKVLSHPASVDSIPTSANQEDHNSMGSIAAKKCLDVINNVKNVIAIEFLCACQGIDFLTPLKSSKPIEAARKLIRSRTSHITKDVLLYEYISSVKQVVYDNNFLDTIEKITGELKI